MGGEGSIQVLALELLSFVHVQIRKDLTLIYSKVSWRDVLIQFASYQESKTA